MRAKLKKGQLLGWVVVKEAFEIRQNSEYAAWYTIHEVQPGAYPITTDGYWVFIKYDTVIKSAYDQSHYGGMPFGSSDNQYENHPDAGKRSQYTTQTYPYLLAEAIHNDTEHEYVMLGWSTRCEQWDWYSLYSGPQKRTFMRNRSDKRQFSYSLTPALALPAPQ